MSISMYDTSITVFIRGLTNMLGVIEKAIAHAEAKKIDEKVFASSRLYPDMLPFTVQINIACDNAKGCAARLAGIEPPKHEDNQVTLKDSHDRIKLTLAFLATIKREQVDGSEERDITIPMRSGPLHMKGQGYLLGFATPNFYFHTATAYDILRHGGVELGKMDFLGKP